VLSDVVLGGPIDGVALARHCREAHPQTPVLLVTGYARGVDAARGEFPLLEKPFDLESLSRSIEAVRRAHAAGDDPKVVRLVRSRPPPGA